MALVALGHCHHGHVGGASGLQPALRFRDDVSNVTGVRMPSCMDPQYPYGQAETGASLAQVLSDQQALARRAHELWQRDAATAGLHS